MRTSLTALAEDPYWQQKRDERKSSLRQTGMFGVPDLPEANVGASTGKSEFIALAPSQTYQSKRIPSMMASPNDASSPPAFGQGSIAALHRPSRASQQDATLWDGSGRMQGDEAALDTGSLHPNSRQGSTVRFALEEGRMSSGPLRGADVPEVCQLVRCKLALLPECCRAPTSQ